VIALVVQLLRSVGESLCVPGVGAAVFRTSLRMAWCFAGEHTVIMLRPLESPEVESTGWLKSFQQDFRCRFMALLPAPFA